MIKTYVIPAYNEENTIGDVICSLSEDVVVVNDASTDKTEQIARKHGVTVLTNKKNMGHAKSLLRGLRAAKGEYVFYLDADNQIRMISLPYNHDLVSGYRVNRQDKTFRKIVSFILKMVIFIRHGYYIRDANCPCKMFKRTSLKVLLGDLPKNSVVPSISLEILARKHHFDVLEIPVTHYPYKNRKGTLQSLNKKSLIMFWKAFWEVIHL
jgi:glycosyltransferase involved in cell wall biosynthesis